MKTFEDITGMNDSESKLVEDIVAMRKNSVNESDINRTRFMSA